MEEIATERRKMQMTTRGRRKGFGRMEERANTGKESRSISLKNE
jgi:hypothetical protein